MKRTALKKRSEKAVKMMKGRQDEALAMKEFWMEIWSTSDHICQSCGAKLGDYARTYFFDHLLEKSKYPKLAFDPNNIFLVCFGCHAKKTNGHPTKKHQEAIDNYKNN